MTPSQTCSKCKGTGQVTVDGEKISDVQAAEEIKIIVTDQTRWLSICLSGHSELLFL